MKTILPRKIELGLDTAFMKESRPVVMPGIDLRRAADPVVAVPAEARPGRAMQLRQHLRERSPIAASSQVELFEDEEIGAMVEDARHARHRAQRFQAIHLRIGRNAVLAKTLIQTRDGCWRG